MGEILRAQPLTPSILERQCTQRLHAYHTPCPRTESNAGLHAFQPCSIPAKSITFWERFQRLAERAVGRMTRCGLRSGRTRLREPRDTLADEHAAASGKRQVPPASLPLGGLREWITVGQDVTSLRCSHSNSRSRVSTMPPPRESTLVLVSPASAEQASSRPAGTTNHPPPRHEPTRTTHAPPRL